jgi:S-formylglutathione hydrolase FrmB
VVYLLQGCCDSGGYISWTRSTDVQQLTAHSDVLVVMPDGGAVGFYSDWLHGPAWETFHLVELRQLLERGYHAGEQRAVAGLSMGGLGAMAYAARHPGMFRAAAAFSGVLHTRTSYGAGPRGITRLIEGNGEDPLGLWGDPDQQAKVWAAHNPYDLVPRLRGTALFVSAGTGHPGPLDPKGISADSLEQFVHAQTVAFVDRLRATHIPATVDLYGPGTHTWPYWQRELHRSWPLLTRALGIR